MASEKKKRKLKNSNCVGGVLKNKSTKLKRIAFFTPSERQQNKKSSEDGK
jgi:hypothetical protein